MDINAFYSSLNTVTARESVASLQEKLDRLESNPAAVKVLADEARARRERMQAYSDRISLALQTAVYVDRRGVGHNKLTVEQARKLREIMNDPNPQPAIALALTYDDMKDSEKCYSYKGRAIGLEEFVSRLE